MGRELSHEECAELLGVHAVDAVDDDERATVDEHLRRCARCRGEVAEHREVAALLVPRAVGAPAGLWERISGSLEESPPPLLLSPQGGRRRARGRVLTGAAAAIAVAASIVAVAVLGIKVVDDGRRIDRMAQAASGTGLARAVNAALTDPAARRVELASSDGRVSVQVVLLRDGTGYLVRNNLPRLDRARTYQLWALEPGAKVSVGVLGPAPDQSAFKAAGDVSGLAITEERGGGVVSTDHDPVVLGSLQPA